MARSYRQTINREHFSEGARLLWSVLERLGLTMRQLRARIDAGTDLTRWLYGDAIPPFKAIVRMQDLYRIPAASWLERTAESDAFIPPAARPTTKKSGGLDALGNKKRTGTEG